MIRSSSATEIIAAERAASDEDSGLYGFPFA